MHTSADPSGETAISLWIAIITTIGAICVAIVQAWIRGNKAKEEDDPDDSIQLEKEQTASNVSYLVNNLVKETMDKCAMLQEQLSREKEAHEVTKTRYTQEALERALNIQSAEFELRIANEKIKELQEDLRERNIKLEEAYQEIKELKAAVERLQASIREGNNVNGGE